MSSKLMLLFSACLVLGPAFQFAPMAAEPGPSVPALEAGLDAMEVRLQALEERMAIEHLIVSRCGKALDTAGSGNVHRRSPV